MPSFKRRNYKPRRPIKRRQAKQSNIQKLMGIAKDSIKYMGPIGRAVSVIKDMINVESKMIDTSVANTISNSGVTVYPLTLVAQGLTDITRNGNSILSQSIAAKVTFTINASATNTLVRWVLFMDKDNAKGTVPTLTDLYDTLGVNSFINKNNSDRFVTIQTGLVELNAGAGLAQTINIYKKLERFHVKYDGTDASQGAAAENHLYLGFLSNEATNLPSSVGNVRYRFYDN
jgi:hypothetical protein